MPSLVIPSDLLPADGRFGCGPSKVRPEQLAAPRRAGAAPARHLAPPGAREGPRRSRAQRPRRPVPPARRLRGRARQRRIDGVLGCRGLRPHRAPQRRTCVFGEFGGKFAGAAAAPWLEAPDVREAAAGTRATAEPRRGRRRLRLAAQRDLHRRDRRRSRGSHGDDGALTVIDATSAAGGIDFDGRRDRRLLLRAAEELRAPTAGCGSRSSRPPPSSAIERIAAIGPLHPRVPQPEERGRQLAPQPDAQHPRARDPAALESSSTGSTATAASRGPTPARASRRRRSTTGPRHPRSPRRSSRTPPTARRSSSRSTSTTSVDAAARRRDPARQRHRRHRAVPQARPQPAARRDVRLDRTRRRARSSSASIDYVLERMD